jgi:Domain of unknown function (DUF4349)
MTHPEDTATIERDLRAVDAALTTGAVTHDDAAARELQELALALRADAPEAEPRFAEELRARVEAGFPRRQASARERQEAALKRIAGRTARGPSRVRAVLLPVAGVGAPLLLIVALVFALGEPGTDSDGGGGADGGAVTLDDAGGGGRGAVESAPDAAAAGREGSTVMPQPVPPSGGFAPGRRDRKIERSISMTLEAPDDEVAAVADGVTRVTGRHGGFVLRSDLNTGEDGASGTFELRIPTARLQPALRELSALATVRSQTQSGQDVTREHVTAKDRLQAARAERRSLLRRLENADTDEEAEAIRRRLDLVAGEINGLRGQLRDLRLRTDYAIVSVELSGEDGDAGGGAGGSFDDALGDAGDLLVGTAGVLIRILALALPLGLVALAAWLTARGVRRRRRESALA